MEVFVLFYCKKRIQDINISQSANDNHFEVVPDA